MSYKIIEVLRAILIFKDSTSVKATAKVVIHVISTKRATCVIE